MNGRLAEAGKALFGKKDKRLPNLIVNKGQAETLRLAVEDAIRRGKVHNYLRLYNRDSKGGMPGAVGEKIPLSEAKELCEDVEAYIGDVHGGRRWTVKMFDAADVEAASYTYSLEGYPPFRKTPRSGGDSSDSDGSGKTSDKELLMMFLKQNMETQTILMKAAMEGGKDDGFKDEIARVLVNNSLAAPDPFDTYAKLKQIEQAGAPAVQGEDLSTALINGIAQLGTAIVSARFGGGRPAIAGAPAPSPLADIDMSQIAKMLENKPAAEVQKVIEGLVSGATPASGNGGGVALPHPGQTQQLPQISPSGDQSAILSSTPAQPLEVGDQPGASISASDDPHFAIINRMIEEFRRDVTNNADPTVLATSLLGIVNYAVAFPSRPAILTGLCTADGDTLENELIRFAAAVPELMDAPEKVEAIRDAIYATLTQQHESHVEAAEVDGEIQRIEEPAEPDGAMPAQVAARTPEATITQEEAKPEGEAIKTDDNVSESTRIPGTGRQRTDDAPGPDGQDQPDSAADDRSAGETVQAASG